MAERMRAARRRKILENAKNRMERLCRLQEGFSCRVQDDKTVEEEGERRKVKSSWKVTENCREKEHRRDSSPVEDPPDELVVPSQLQRPLIQPVNPSVLPPPSLISRWTAVLCRLGHVRLLLAILAGVTVSLTYVAMGYNIPCFLCLVTSELCFLLCTLISAVTTGACHPPSESAGTLAMLKIAIEILYPPAAVMVECLQQVTTVAGIVCQDLCVAVFSLVIVSVLLSTFVTI